ncbi:cytochrome P450 [Phenylobacterium sp.]|jgi:cytochrome P450|uniref:cytochrome P450 n=1 Tax=Phenylobacterium sp. TaxID=1871053 RepID=UPI002E36CCD8|nr:cytochrome P450 [Phenylobacterium sp.]HEX2561268.1 cytochrome P450 [Phenylobacterium sp.]
MPVAIEKFRPACPDRPDVYPSFWSSMFGAQSRNPIIGWTKASFEVSHASRSFPGFTYHTLNDPELIQQVFLDRQPSFGKPSLMRKFAGRYMGGSLFLEEGEIWRSQRRLMAPTFTPGSVAAFHPIFVEAGERTANRWAQEAPGVIDVDAEAVRTTFDVISRALFSGEHGLGTDEAAEHVENLLASVLRPGALLGGLGWLDQTRRTRKGRAAEAFLISRLSAFIAARQADPEPPGDFMTQILQAFAQDHPPEEAARLALSNAVIFLVAGHETTAHALAWTLYLLSEDQQAQAWAAEEARAALSRGGTPAETLEHLIYLRMVLEESLRLYPPAPRLEREAKADEVVGDLQIRKGDWVGVWPWLVHRHKALWRDPDLFDPENFSPEAKEGRHKFQYIPFGAGPRICIGAQFATAEALLVLAQWLARFEFAPTPGHRVEVFADMTLKPVGGMPLRVYERLG